MGWKLGGWFKGVYLEGADEWWGLSGISGKVKG